MELEKLIGGETIMKGTKLRVDHSRRGRFFAIATDNFIVGAPTFLPVALAQGEYVKGLAAPTDWVEGEEVPCRYSLVTELCRVVTL